MKKIVILLVLVALAWKLHDRRPAAPAPAPSTAALLNDSIAERLADAPSAPHFTCDGRLHCSQMRSCEEAAFFMKNCPGTKMDGDHDGIPCERQFCQ